MATDSHPKFIPYPDIEDDNFYETLFAKKEFNKTAHNGSFRYKTTDEMCTRGEFKMQNHQEFIRNFISPETPYNGVLLFHGTGVGKTCASIGITEGLRDYVKNSGKIFILSSENIRPNFYKELYDPGREAVEREFHSMPGSYQCASDKYYPEGVSQSAREAAVKSLINQYYAFYGFGAFANFVDIGLGAKLPEHISAPKYTNEEGGKIDIGEYFGNSVIVIDEAHGIAGKRFSGDEEDVDVDVDLDLDGLKDDDDDDTELEGIQLHVQDDESMASRKTLKKAITNRTLFEVLISSVIPACLKKGYKLKLILLTATPMKDNIQELANLLQLLHVNDGRMEASDNAWRNEYFPVRSEDEGQITEDMAKGIKKLARGYISYVKGNNPITFPLPLNPPEEFLYEPARDAKGKLRPMYPYRKYGESASEDISATYDIRLQNNTPLRFQLVKCPMSLFHFKCYVAQLRGSEAKESSDTHTRMASNFAFPNSSYGNKGFDACFKKSTKDAGAGKKYTYYTYQDSIYKNHGNFLKQSLKKGLSYYSQKFNQFVDFINNGPLGVVYAYSEFVKAGALIGALVLEANGFIRYTPDLHKNLNKSGLPGKDIEKKYPQAHLLHLGDAARGGPENFYRCAKCGKIYNECIKYKGLSEHQFAISTYVLVTASIGSINDIGAATVDNKDGSKIRVILGTKTTGQGVDFKWVRQVHILDPWHNNTRIYQAIGRGLRHCSHADLPINDRNVTIYRYSSTPSTEPDIKGKNMDDKFEEGLIDDETISHPQVLTYRDFYTETVDEHMYLRVYRKDLLIKKIERLLKEVAVDCELNRMRNYFPSDIDYSRECDYTLCKYSCDGFVVPIKYIRKIRKTNDGWFIIDDEDTLVRKDHLSEIDHLMKLIDPKEKATTNEEIWNILKRKYMILQLPEAEDMLVDIPLINIDNSTYDIYFSSPQVDRAMKIITRLYQKSVAMSLSKIVYQVKSLDPSLEDNFIFVAIDKLVGNLPAVKPVNFVDRYGRNGYIVYHNGYYIYQPIEIKDTSTPLFYRMRPLTIKRRFYNMDQLAPKKTEVVYAAASMNTDKLDGFIQTYENEEFTSVIDLFDMYVDLNAFMLSEHKYIIETVIAKVWNNPPEDTNSWAYIIEYYLHTGLLMFKDWVRPTKDNEDNSIIHIVKNKKYNPLHFISVDGNMREYKIMVNNDWNWKDVSDFKIPELTYEDIYYPCAPTFNGSPAKSKPVFPKLNLNDTSGIYGFVSGTFTRVNKPLPAKGQVPVLITAQVKRLITNYPDSKSISSVSLKIVDESTKKSTFTKEEKESGRNKLRGIACRSLNGEVTKTQIMNLNIIIKDNFAKFTENRAVDKIVVKVDEEGGLAAAREGNCKSLEKLLFIADYYLINGKKWYLSTIETEFYRPASIKTPKA